MYGCTFVCAWCGRVARTCRATPRGAVTGERSPKELPLCTAVHLCVRGAGGRVDGQCACGACLARVGGPRRPSLKSGVHSHWVPSPAGAARILCIVPKSRAFSHMRRRSASKAAEAVPLDQLTGANGACSSCVGTPIACTLEHASATRARRGVTARAKKKRRVCVFTQRTFTSPGPWPLNYIST